VTNVSSSNTIISTIQRSQSYSAAKSLQHIGTSSHQHGQLKSEQKVLAIWMYLRVTFMQPANNYQSTSLTFTWPKTELVHQQGSTMARRTLWAFSWIHSRYTEGTGRVQQSSLRETHANDYQVRPLRSCGRRSPFRGEECCLMRRGRRVLCV
jgi:hypothetical protein